MFKLIIVLGFLLLAALKLAQPASYLTQPSTINVVQKGSTNIDTDLTPTNNNPDLPDVRPPQITTLPTAHYNFTTQLNSATTVTAITTTSLTTTSTSSYTTTTSTTSTTQDPNADLEDSLPPLPNSTPSNDLPSPPIRFQTPNKSTNPFDNLSNNKSKPLADQESTSIFNRRNVDHETSIFFFSIFIVYVSLGKLLYHNVGMIKRNMTEPGILMIFGIIWELVSRQVTSASNESNPRFNSRFFFYIFLPSVVLESTLRLSNKWLFLNLLPILVHSIFGTVLYAASLGFTIYSLTKQNFFNLGSTSSLPTKSPVMSQLSSMIYNTKLAQSVSGTYKSYDLLNSTGSLYPVILVNDDFPLQTSNRMADDDPLLYNTYDKSYAISGSSGELNNLTLADCLVFGTILSSVDSNTMLDVFRIYQVNDRLYYFVLGESLLNNAVVLIILALLLDFFNASRLTAVKIYVAVLQFFITLIGSFFVGFILAGITLVLVRLIKRFQVPSALANYQNQCQATVETLLILKLAYLTYTLASLTGTSGILSLATYGILQDQYIIHNLNLRSQLTFKQVILATKTMGFSLIYPLLGMLLVEVASTSQFLESWGSTINTDLTSSNNYSLSNNTNYRSINNNNYISPPQKAAQSTPRENNYLTEESMGAASNQSVAQENLYWNFKFLSVVTVMTVVYRIVWVFSLSLLCNLFSRSQLRIRFKEQVLIALGSLKGPLAFAIVHRLIEHEDYKDRTTRNKHLFIYTILFITFVSTIIKGPFIKPLVSKITLSLNKHPSLTTRSSLATSTSARNQQIPIQGSGKTIHNSSIVFDEINSKLTEHVSYGLNSIIGHKKSLYDRFVELNETHIKPWLTRSSCNTNWLSVFYDTLILDETLNANCFYKSVGLFGIGTGTYLYPKALGDNAAPKQGDEENEDLTTGGGGGAIRQHGGVGKRRQSSFRLMDTIEENRLALINRQQHPPVSRTSSKATDDERLSSKFSSAKHAEGGLSKKNHISLTATTSKLINRSQEAPPSLSSSQRAQLVNQLKPVTGGPENQDDKSSLLKEFVMFNLKLEEAKKRRDTISKLPQRIPPNENSGSDLRELPQTRYNARKPSTSDSNAGGAAMGFQETSSFELKPQQPALMIEQQRPRHHHPKPVNRLQRTHEFDSFDVDDHNQNFNNLNRDQRKRYDREPAHQLQQRSRHRRSAKPHSGARHTARTDRRRDTNQTSSKTSQLPSTRVEMNRPK